MLGIVNKTVEIFIVTLVLITVSALFVGCGASTDQPDPEITLDNDDPADVNTVETENDPITVEEISPQTPDVANPDVSSEKDDSFSENLIDFKDDQIKRETRAVWTWAGRKGLPGRKKITNLDIDDLVAKVDAAHLNVILISVYHKGTAYFQPSHTRFPDSSQRLTNQSTFSSEGGYPDALSYLLAIRDERRLDEDPFNDFEVHAWISVNSGGDIDNEWPPIDKTEPYMLNALFPEFKLKHGAYYLEEDERFVRHDTSDVHQPRFRAYMVDLIAGLAEDYDIDGVHLDFIRTGGICFNNESLDYPGTEYDYPGCQEDYKAWTRENYGHEYTLWDDTDGHREIQDGGSGRVAAWQERTVGMLVKSIHDEVKSVRPDVIVSAAAVTNPNTPEARRASTQGQVAWDWLDQGWLDAAFVTVYSADTQHVIDRLQAIRGAAQKKLSRSKILPGLATHDINNPEYLWSYLIVEQVNALARGQWNGETFQQPVQGMAFFLDRRLSEEAVQALANGPFKEPALSYWGE